MPRLLIHSALLPVLNCHKVYSLFLKVTQMGVSMFIEMFNDLGGWSIFVHESNFFKTVNNSFEVFLSDWAKFSLSFRTFKEFSVLNRKLIILVLKAEVDVVCIYCRYMLHIPSGLCNFVYWGILKINSNYRTGRGQILFLLIRRNWSTTILSSFICRCRFGILCNLFIYAVRLFTLFICFSNGRHC